MAVLQPLTLLVSQGNALRHPGMFDRPKERARWPLDLVAIPQIEPQSLIASVENDSLRAVHNCLFFQTFQNLAAETVASPGIVNGHVADLSFIVRIEMESTYGNYRSAWIFDH